jgi:hypothetical protein
LCEWNELWCTNTRNEIFDLALVELAKAGRTTRISEVGE